MLIRLFGRVWITGVVLAQVAGCSSQESLLDRYDGRDTAQIDAVAVDDQAPAQLSHSITADASRTTFAPISDQAFRDAAYQGDGPTVSQAIASGIDINSPDTNGRTALMLAAYDGRTEIVKLLLKHNPQVNRRDAMDRTALTYAASGENPETVAALLAAKAEVDVLDNEEGWTPLMFASAEGNMEVVKLLLAHGANCMLADKDGETPLQFAASRGHTRVANLLKENIAARTRP